MKIKDRRTRSKFLKIIRLDLYGKVTAKLYETMTVNRVQKYLYNSSIRWICVNCRWRQSRRYNSTLASPVPDSSEELGEQTQSISPNHLEAKKVVPHKKDRTHLKNYGQYFITTPIFYVNGGSSSRKYVIDQLPMSAICIRW
jgi:hypothetical protein